MAGRSKDLYLGLVEAAPDAIIAVEPDGSIELVNAQAERLFGYPRDELIGRPIEVLVPDASRQAHRSLRAGYVRDPRPRPMGGGLQLAGRRKDGTEFPADISLSAFETANGLVMAVAVRDVTERLAAQAAQEGLRAEAERERFEARLHQSQRLESLGQLAGGVAHDFNNLLGAILNYTAFISKSVAAAASEEAERWEPVLADLRQVQRAAERAAELTHQLLTFGRRDVANPVIVSLNDVVSAVEQLLRRTIGEQIQLVISPSPDLWPVLADPGQLEQVLLNLAVNARDAMVNGGRIDIDTANLVIDASYANAQPNLEAGRYVRLRLSDTGMGMPPEVRAQAFDPFFTTKAKGDGSGLGLATVHGIVTQAGGHVRIYSEPGLGTTVTALLPAVEPTSQTVSPPPRRAAQGQGETILVVEDDEAMREVTRRILAGNGHHVIATGSGREALEVISTGDHDVQLLLTDVVMPHMLGKELAERVTSLMPAVRVLFMSGYAGPVLASQGTLEPGVCLVEKPFTEQVLLAKIREVLDGS